MNIIIAYYLNNRIAYYAKIITFNKHICRTA